MFKVREINADEFRAFIHDHADTLTPARIVDICAHYRQGLSVLYGVYDDQYLAGVLSVKEGVIEFMSAPNSELDIQLLMYATKDCPITAPLGLRDPLFEMMGCRRIPGGFEIRRPAYNGRGEAHYP